MAKRQRMNCAAAPRPRRLGRIAAVAGLLTLGLFPLGLVAAGPAMARHGHRDVASAEAAGPVFEWLLLDADTGQVLSEQNADVLTYPASLTKMMTLYLAFEALNQGRIRLDQTMYVSPYAASRAPSKLALTPGDQVPVRDLILGIVTKSANDAATVLAEGLAGSEPNFARYMTWKARQLGMTQTWYHNASGLPDPGQRTTARDIARLALALYHQFPREYRYFATREFDFRGETVHSHNHLLEWYQGADGIKTGYINASGFNLAASAVRNGHRLIGVIMGGRSARGRDIQMASLLDQGFAVVANGRAAPPQPATVVAAAAPPIPAAAPVSPAAQTAVAAAHVAAHVAAAAPDPADVGGDAPEHPKSRLGNVAQAALRHLAPVGRAEAAAPPAREASAGDDWAIQIGAFGAERAAEQAVRHVAELAVAKGKPHQVLPPAKRERPPLYRARLLHFTQKSAHAACAELHRHKIACSIVRPSGVKLASD